VSVSSLVLASHALCPYVQRAAIVLAEKGLTFERRVVDLARKPDWFLAVSPLGKTPVLLVGGEPVFESAVICDYLDETQAPALHPADALERARHRGWVEFASQLLGSIGSFYSAPDEPALEAARRALRQRFVQLEAALDGRGPFFSGARFAIVDAAFAPALRYFETIDTLGDWGFFDGLTRVRSWRAALATRASVRDTVAPDYAARLSAFIAQRGSALASRIR
jgi:glutathione S-transferase